MIRTDQICIPVKHVGSIMWPPGERWEHVVIQINAILRDVEEDAEVEMSTTPAGHTALYVSFPQGPLIEFLEGGALTLARDSNRNLVCWASPKWSDAPIDRRIARMATDTHLPSRTEMRMGLRKAGLLSALAIAVALGAVVSVLVVNFWGSL